MAEAFLNESAADLFEAESAGLEPGKMNPIVVEVMAEIGIDISKNRTKSASDIFKSGKKYDYVITVCDEANAKRCPVLPGTAKKLHWGFEDPSGFGGSNEDKLERTRKVRDIIKTKVEDFIK